MPASFGVVDLFAGPGGLGEGFSSMVDDAGHHPFRISLSVEKENSAHRTLTLRKFLREYRQRHGYLPDRFIEFHAGRDTEPDWAAVDTESWRHAVGEARCLELGTESTAEFMDDTIDHIRRKYDDTILIGGPPCQAYSLVGRSRSKGIRGYRAENDNRHFLFREYVRVLERLRPAAFVMENVKGMLSSKVESRLVFEMLVEHLSSLGTDDGHLYELRAIQIENGRAVLREPEKPSDFVVQAEKFGVPQRRHRLFIVGIRSDLANAVSSASISVPDKIRSVEDTIGNLPPLRSGLSRKKDDPDDWRSVVVAAAQVLAGLIRSKDNEDIRDLFRAIADGSEVLPVSRSLNERPDNYGTSNDELMRWLEEPQLRAIAQHETRGHMESDLGRYLFAAAFGRVRERSPKAAEFPFVLQPDHRNWTSGDFSDRFRVQLAHEPATTITSHISKDGHYFIHHDPRQCRSLTVREAARLQTFPDDYVFLGNRTQQYVQVGNAVPPFLARQIASLILQVIDPPGRSST